MPRPKPEVKIKELYNEINSCRKDIATGNGATCKECSEKLDLIESLKEKILSAAKRQREVVDCGIQGED